MLHSFQHRKSHLYKRYLGHRDSGEKRVCEEDEITSLIVGPLDYLPPDASGAFWTALIERDATGDLALPTGPVSRVQMDFWPRNTIEPDLLVQLFWSTGERRILLVEFKWNAPLSGADQLHRQWNEFLSAAERKIAHHVFIAPEVSAGLNALGEQDIWDGRLVLRSWANILDILKTLSCPVNSGLAKWRLHVTSLLGKLGIDHFKGFKGLPAISLPSRSPIFWSSVSGVGAIKLPSVSAHADQPDNFSWSLKK